MTLISLGFWLLPDSAYNGLALLSYGIIGCNFTVAIRPLLVILPVYPSLPAVSETIGVRLA